MKGDFSRNTFDQAKHFTRVLMQQGRAQLDADSNEQTAILLHYLRTLAADLIGPFAGPAGADWGFEITPGEGKDDFSIGQGRYYVDGILCENDAAVTYKTQKDFPKPPSLETIHKCLVYLDVWERHLTALENDDIREKALGGADTASRAQVVWQVKVQNATPTRSKFEKDVICSEWAKWIALWQPPHLGCLKARVIPSEDTKDPCLTAPDSKYRGQENQLYRVEIHETGKAGTATLKWSRDNGAIATSCDLKGTELIAGNPRGFAANQWVELTNDGQELRGHPGTLVKVVKVEGERLTLEKVVSSKPVDVPDDQDWPTKVRRWDQSEKGGHKLTNGAVPVVETVSDIDWFELEDGIQIQFQPSADEDHPNHYRTGDYWLIPARVLTGNIEWPVELKNNGKPDLDANGNTKPIPKGPFGIRHHYAPLATLTKVAGGSAWEVKDDCRCSFQSLNSCEIESHGEEGMGGTPVCSSG